LIVFSLPKTLTILPTAYGLMDIKDVGLSLYSVVGRRAVITFMLSNDIFNNLNCECVTIWNMHTLWNRSERVPDIITMCAEYF